MNTPQRSCVSIAVFLLAVLIPGSAIGQDQPRGGPANVANGVIPERFYNSVHALCIGIDRYSSPGVTELKWSEKDAQEMAKLFDQHYGFQVKTLLGKQATRAAILESLRSYTNRLGPDDALLVFFAGHGETVPVGSFERTGYLIPFDAQVTLGDTANAEQWTREALDMRELAKLARMTEARHVLVIADVCYSGFFRRRSGITQRADLQRLLRCRSRMVITAGTEEEEALESEELQHGVFTHALLRQLSQNIPTSVTEVFLSVRQGVAARTNQRMMPQLTEMEVENGEFVFIPSAVKDVTEALESLNERALRRRGQGTRMADLFQASVANNYPYAADPAEKERQWRQRATRFEQNAALGDPLAMAGMSYCAGRGLGMERDEQLALKWAQRAFDTGHAAGKHMLALCYLGGIGVTQNEVAGDELMRQAAAEGFPLSICHLGLELVDRAVASGEALPADERQKMLHYLRSAADEGYVVATYGLGEVLGNGIRWRAQGC